MTEKEYGKLTRMKTHLRLVKLIARKRAENGVDDADGKGRGRQPDDDADFDFDDAPEIDGPQAFMDTFGE